MSDLALFAPFTEFAFMRRALVACVALSVSGALIGALLMMRRLNLMADSMAHAVLPGAAAGYLLAGLSVWAMALGGALAAALVATLSSFISRRTAQREEASFAAIYISAFAAGVLLVAAADAQLDLLHLLFGNVLAVDDEHLLFIGFASSLVLAVAAVSFRPLILDALQPRLLAGSPWQRRARLVFSFLLVVHLIASFQVLGTLMAVGLLVIPAAAARLWTSTLEGQLLAALAIALLATLVGLQLSYHAATPAGPSIVAVCGGIYLLSCGFGARRTGVLDAS